MAWEYQGSEFGIQNWNDTKMTPKWHENDVKMAWEYQGSEFRIQNWNDTKMTLKWH